MARTTGSRRGPLSALALVGSLMVAAHFGTSLAADVAGSKDHPLVKRYQGSEILRYQTKAFDEYALLVKAATRSGGKDENSDSTTALEGRITRLTYGIPEGRSTLEVFRNYQRTLEDAGFEPLFECKNKGCGGRKFNHAVVEYNLEFGDHYRDQRYLASKLARKEGDVYLSLYVVHNNAVKPKRAMVQLDVIELAAMEERMVVVKAGEMAKEIGDRGRIALYGIYFDFDKAALKPESKPTLDEIAKLLDERPALKLVIVGHTDNKGSLDYNRDLSRRRAAAVERALIEDYGIDGSRLSSWGVGFLSPVASNQTEEGRAANRRVELVER